MSSLYVMSINSKEELPVYYDVREPDSLSFEEMIIITDHFRDIDKTVAEVVMSSLVEHRCVSDVVRLEDGEKVHISPFENVPAKLMKMVDRMWIEELCLS